MLGPRHYQGKGLTAWPAQWVTAKTLGFTNIHACPGSSQQPNAASHPRAEVLKKGQKGWPSTAPSTYHSWLPGAHPVFNLPVLMGSQASHVKVQHLTGMSLWTRADIRFLRPSGRGSEPLLHHHSWRQWMLMFLNHLPIAAECFKSSMKWDLANTRISFPFRRIGPETKLYCSYVMLRWTSDNTSDPLE